MKSKIRMWLEYTSAERRRRGVRLVFASSLGCNISNDERALQRFLWSTISLLHHFSSPFPPFTSALDVSSARERRFSAWFLPRMAQNVNTCERGRMCACAHRVDRPPFRSHGAEPAGGGKGNAKSQRKFAAMNNTHPQN